MPPSIIPSHPHTSSLSLLQVVTKEKMLACMERDRAVSEVSCLQTTLHSLQPSSAHDGTHGTHPSPVTPIALASPPGTKNVAGGDVKATECEAMQSVMKLPDDPSNPYLFAKLPECAHLTRTGGFQLTSHFQAHEYAVSK